MAGITFMGPRSNGITICDDADRPTGVPAPDAALHGAMEADLDFARQLQAKLDAEEARGGASNRSACQSHGRDPFEARGEGFPGPVTDRLRGMRSSSAMQQHEMVSVAAQAPSWQGGCVHQDQRE